MLSKVFSVVVPTCNRNDLLSLCLERLAPGMQEFPADQYEVIVSDDGPGATARGFVTERYPWVQYVEGPRRGPASNRNHAAKVARGEWLAFTDDDCVPERGWLAGYFSAQRLRPEEMVFEGRIFPDRPRASLAEIAPVNETGGYLWSSNFAIKRSLFEELQGFDERFRVAMEDVDFRYRLEKRGYRATFVREASVCHPWRSQKRSRDGWKRLSGYTEDTLRYLALHPPESKRLSARYFAVGALRSFLKDTVPGIFRFRGRGWREALTGHLGNLNLAVEILRGTPSKIRKEESLD